VIHPGEKSPFRGMAMGTLWTMAPALMLPYHPLRAMDQNNIDLRDH